MVEACKGLAAYVTIDFHVRRVGLQGRDHIGMHVANQKPFFQVVLHVCRSLAQRVNVDVYLWCLG